MADEITTSSVNAPSNDDKNIATITHLGGTVFSFIPSLIVWVLKKEDSVYVSNQAKEALNFQISILLAYFISWMLAIVLIGFLFVGIVWLINIVFCIIAAISTSKGESYRYPFCLRLIN
jgi:uncharacterized protein